MSHAAAHAMQTMFTALSHAMWSVVGGFVMIGAAFYGGPIIVTAWQDANRARAERQARAAAIRHEATEGIAEIEAFLAQQLPAPPRTDRPIEQQEQHRLPPT